MQPDATTAYLLKFWPWIEANKNRLAVGAGVVVVAVLLISFLVWEKNQRETTAGMALTKAIMSISTRGNAANAYLKVATDYPGAKAGVRALLQGATALFVAGKYADAQVQFQHFLDSYQDNSLAAQAALGVAACLDAQGKTDAAVSAYKNVISRYSDGDVLAEAKFALARVYDSQGEFAAARDIYKDVALAYPYNSLGQEAAVRAEELKLPAKPALVNPANLGNFLSFTTNSSISKPNQH